MDALLPLNKLCEQVYCFNPSVTLRSVQSGSHTKKKRKLVFTLQAVLPQRLLIYWKRYFMLDFLSHIHRDTTAGCGPFALTALKMWTHLWEPFSRFLFSFEKAVHHRRTQKRHYPPWRRERRQHAFPWPPGPLAVQNQLRLHNLLISWPLWHETFHVWNVPQSADVKHDSSTLQLLPEAQNLFFFFPHPRFPQRIVAFSIATFLNESVNLNMINWDVNKLNIWFHSYRPAAIWD